MSDSDDVNSWRVGVDIGGTFTDVVLWNGRDDAFFVDKLLTSTDDPSRSVVNGIRNVIHAAGIRGQDVASVIHGTTLVANALIERKGVKTALLTTRGFKDVLEIGREWRYDLFDLEIDVPTPLVPRHLRAEIDERIDAHGAVLEPLSLTQVAPIIDELVALGVRSVGVCLLHAYLNGEHERAVAQLVRERHPSVALSLSAEVSPELGEYERTSTTVANAYVHPLFRDYVERLTAALVELGCQRELLLVLSDGRLVRATTATRFPVRLVQSGPAAGAEAARLFGELAQVDNVLCFDMGGTTAKACLIADGQPEHTAQFEVARETRFAEGSGLPLQIPAIDMIEIGAGGGSIARVDRRGLIQVGPDSAGADPGPACYGRGNELPTVTDCDLVLGYLDANAFLGGRMQLDEHAARDAISKHLATPLNISVEEAAWGVHETVTANMAQAATIHAIERAIDVTRYAMLPIGGAGPVHACGMAAKMNISQLICPTSAGVASAVGMLSAPISFEVGRAAPMRLNDLDFASVAKILADMESEASALVAETGVDIASVERRCLAMMRYVGQGYEIATPIDLGAVASSDSAVIEAAFARAYEARYGRTESMPVEILSWRIIVEGPRSALADRLRARGTETELDASPRTHRAVWFGESYVETPVYSRAQLRRGQSLAGPAIIEETESTTVLPPTFQLVVDAALNLRLSALTGGPLG